MKKLLTFVLALVLCLSTVHAEQKAGISPDNPMLWRIEIFFEHIDIAITYDKTKKIEKHMECAEERAAEMEKMLRWKNTEGAETAKAAYEKELASVAESIAELDYKNPESEFEAENTIQSTVLSAQKNIAEIITAMNAAELDDAQKQLVEQFSALTFEDIHAKLTEKKDATILKLKANGLTDENIAALQGEILDIVENIKEDIEEQIEETTDTVETNTTTGENVAEGPSESTEASAEELSSEAMITDISSNNKVKIDGDLTAEQLQAVNILYNQLIAESTDAEVELTVSQMSNGMWKIEKEVDGTLTSLQNQQLDELLVSLSKTPSSVHVKIKYDPAEVETAGLYSGGNGDVETTFVIG
jgi:hypothetical protein